MILYFTWGNVRRLIIPHTYSNQKWPPPEFGSLEVVGIGHGKPDTAINSMVAANGFMRFMHVYAIFRGMDRE